MCIRDRFQEDIADDNQAPPGQVVAAVAGLVPDVTGVAAPIQDATAAPIQEVTGAPIQEVAGVAAPLPGVLTATIPLAGPIPGVDLRLTATIPRMTRVAAPTSSAHVPAVFTAINSKEIRDNGLPSPYHASRNIRTSMLSHPAFLVMQVFGNIQRGVYCEDRVQTILDNDRRLGCTYSPCIHSLTHSLTHSLIHLLTHLDMVNEGKKEARKHLLDPNQVTIGLPGESNVEKRCFLNSSFPEPEFPSSMGNNNGIECFYPPVKFGFRSPDERWVQRVAVAVPDINEVLPIVHPLPTNPPGYICLLYTSDAADE